MADTMKLKFSRTPGKVPTPGMFTADDIFVWNIADGLLYGRKLGTDGTYSVVLVGKAISNDDGQPVDPGEGENFISDVFIEKDGQFPFDVLKIVKNGETVDVTTIPRPNGILWGGMITWSGTGYVYSLNPTGWNMNGEFFAIDENLSFTLATPDATHDRFDVFALNNEGQCVVITGTPAADPVIPSVDAETQRFLTSVLVTAASTAPDNDLAVVYDEGAVAEFTPTSNMVDINFAATFNPFHGTKHVDVGTIFHNRYLLFTAAESFDVGLYTNINFALSLKVVMSNQHNLYVSFFEAGSMISNEVPVALQKDMTGRYQVVALPINAFNFPGNNKQADAIRLRWSKTGSNIGHRGFLLDYLKLESGLTPPVIESTVELTGDVKGTGKVGEAIQTTINAPTAQTTLGDNDNFFLKVGTSLRTLSGANLKASISRNIDGGALIEMNYLPEQNIDGGTL